jgi:hypothetical protein
MSSSTTVFLAVILLGGLSIMAVLRGHRTSFAWR